jgi:hypothetical protein
MVTLHPADSFAGGRTAGYHPITNPSFTTESGISGDGEDWYLWVKDAPDYTFGATDAYGSSISRTTAVYYSAPAALELAAGPARNDSTSRQINISSQPDVYWAWVDTSGAGLPTGTFNLSMQAKYNLKGTLQIYWDVLMYDTATGNLGWVGHKMGLETALLDTAWTAITSSADVDVDHNEWESIVWRQKTIELAKASAYTGAWEWHLTLKIELTNADTIVTDTAKLWLDDVNLTYTPGSNAVAPSSARGRQLQGIRMDGRTARFAAPTNYRLTVLDARGRAVGTQSGFGPSANAPTGRCAAGSYIFRAQSGLGAGAALLSNVK